MDTKCLSSLRHLNTPYRYALAKQLKSLPHVQVRAKHEQLKKLYVECHAQRVASNCARQAEDQQEARDRELAYIEVNKYISATTRQLEAAKVEVYKIATGASSGTQLDEANKVQRRTTPHNRQRGQQSDNTRQPANLNTMDNFCFTSESDDRPLPPPRETYKQTYVVDSGRQNTPVNRPTAGRPSTTTICNE